MFFTLIVCIFLLTSCETMDQTYKIKNFFSDSVLTYGKINGLPRPVDAKDVTATAADVVEFKTTKDGFIKNVTNNFLICCVYKLYST